MPKIDIKALYKEYEKDTSIWSEESQKMRVIKDAIETLSQPEKIILLMYAETGSLRKLAIQLDVTHSAVIKEVKKIRNKIKKYIEDVSNKADTVAGDNGLPD